MTSDPPDLFSHPGLQSELAYWDRELSLQGDYPRAILGRLLPERMADEFPFYIMPLVEELHKEHARVPRVCDVGSGPLSMLAYGVHHGFMEVVLADPLAEPYRQLLAKYGYTPTAELIPCHGERLSETFGTDAFEMVWIHNALDHCQRPDLVLRECAAVLRPGGYLIFQGWSREGTAESWVGLHQHDIYLVADGSLMCESRDADGTMLVRRLNQDLPLEVVESSEPTSDVKKWIRIIWRKSPR